MKVVPTGWCEAEGECKDDTSPKNKKKKVRIKKKK